MSITYPLSLPSSPAPVSFTLSLQHASSMNSSPFTGEQQVYKWPRELWMAEVKMPPMKRAAAEEWIAFLLQLQGQYGTFLMGHSAAKTPRGTASGTPLVNGADQTGKTLITDGWTHGVTGIMKAGDHFQIGTTSSSRLYKMLKDVDSDGSGNAVLEFTPRLRVSPADNAAIIVTNPVGLWRLADNTPTWDIGRQLTYGIAFKAIEAL